MLTVCIKREWASLAKCSTRCSGERTKRAKRDVRTMWERDLWSRELTTHRSTQNLLHAQTNASPHQSIRRVDTKNQIMMGRTIARNRSDPWWKRQICILRLIFRSTTDVDLYTMPLSVSVHKYFGTTRYIVVGTHAMSEAPAVVSPSCRWRRYQRSATLHLLLLYIDVFALVWFSVDCLIIASAPQGGLFVRINDNDLCVRFRCILHMVSFTHV